MSCKSTPFWLSQDDPDDNGESTEGGSGSETAVIPRPGVEAKEPSLYRVLLHNDDFTPMEFVVHVLEDIFNLDTETAHKIMMDVHQKGLGCCGIFPFDIAETKVSLVQAAARDNEYPLKCSMEK